LVGAFVHVNGGPRAVGKAEPDVAGFILEYDIGQASALCPIASFLSYWDSRPSETTMQQRFWILHSTFLNKTKIQD
jgi:hypothetical protein